MSYGLFLILFVCIPLALLIGFGRIALTRRALLAMLALVALALVYTTPWDNYLVATRVWYYDPGLVLNVILGYVPLEEYLFFILQSVLVSLFAFWLWRRFYPQDWPSTRPETPPPSRSRQSTSKSASGKAKPTSKAGAKKTTKPRSTTVKGTR